MWNLSDVSKLCKLLLFNVLLCEAGKTLPKPEPEPEPEPEEADLLVQYGVSGVIPEPESEPEYQGYYQGNHGYQGQGYYGQYGRYNHGGQKASMYNPYYYWNSFYRPGNFKG